MVNKKKSKYNWNSLYIKKCGSFCVYNNYFYKNMFMECMYKYKFKNCKMYRE